jgi:hypothetical protein
MSNHLPITYPVSQAKPGEGGASLTGRALLKLSALTAALTAVFAGPAWADINHVTNTSDSGRGSLRRAIELVNHGGYDSVVSTSRAADRTRSPRVSSSPHHRPAQDPGLQPARLT